MDSSEGISKKEASRPQLVLDIGGVLATNLAPMLWQRLAAVSGLPQAELYAVYKQQHSRRLWRGELSERQFWGWIREQAPDWTDELGRELIGQCLQPLPALERLPQWQQTADVHLMSNHLLAWAEPAFSNHSHLLSSITISSEIGASKPDRAIFEHVAIQLPADSLVLFVDDQQRNLDQATALGWRTLLADEQGAWADAVLPMLELG